MWSFQQIGEFEYPTQGWGLTHDGTNLIMSDGTSTLYFLSPVTFEEGRAIDVRDQGRAVQRLNELEYINGVIYANVWKTNRIARIDPQNGEVIDWIDLTGLLDFGDNSGTVDVLNGIAYDAVLDRLFVTGKLWPNLFEIEVIE
jgi:glutamine cyclotransferase